MSLELVWYRGILNVSGTDLVQRDFKSVWNWCSRILNVFGSSIEEF